MKNTLLLATGIIATICVQAQNTPVRPVAAIQPLEAFAPVAHSLPASETKLINVKALREFNKKYKNVTNEEWGIINTGIEARFTEQDILYRVTYNKKGHWVATFRYYNEKQLTTDIRNLVKSSFYNFNITGVTEVTYNGKTAYLVNIEDNETLKIIKVVNDEMEVVQDLHIIK